ncbi:acetoin utilization protein AcuC [Pseudoroseicyclus aestuarii]|nr:acetoin utilization protein AcuC [Pseudoroseicyclus aestuarii]
MPIPLPRGPAPAPLFIGSEVYRGSSYGDWHPLRVPRVSTVIDLARALGWLPRADYRTSPRARPAALTAFHTPDYVAALERVEAAGWASEADRERHALGTVSNPVFPEMFRRPATGVGGAMLAGALLAQGGVVHQPGGGTHHGMPDRANGFCYLNDPVFAILALKAHGARRVAYVDIDAHPCDGVEAAFARDPEVLLISTHEAGRWPRTGALHDEGVGQVFNLPLPKFSGDDAMALARDAVILPAVQRFAPDAVVLQCGADGLREDPQARLDFSGHAHLGVLEGLRPLAPRLLVQGGGGYNPWSVGRLWTAIWGRLSGQELPDLLPPEAQAVLTALRFQAGAPSVIPPPGLIARLLDAPRPGQIEGDLRAGVQHLAGRLRAQV